MSDLRFTVAEFERACSLLPEGATWGEHLNVEIVLHIADASRRAALEEAAKHVETLGLVFFFGEQEFAKTGRACIAAAIRALADGDKA
jgi:hypothetical protein